MPHPESFPRDPDAIGASVSALREAMARDAYARNIIRLVDPDLSGQRWLAATHSGLFAITPETTKRVAHGWFFGLCRHGDALYVYENCSHRDRSKPLGRILLFDIAEQRLTAGRVIATGLHSACHQIAIIDGLLCVIDTANQAIVRLTLEGDRVDVRHPFPVASSSDTSGAYLHVNSLAMVGDRIALMLHNGKAIPEKPSEIAWLDRDWQLIERRSLPGHSCHDIVEDEDGVLWHCDSLGGDLIASDGRRVHVTDTLMTRGLAFSDDAIIVGISIFGPRHLRHGLRGGVTILDRALNHRTTMMMDGAPAAIIAL